MRTVLMVTATVAALGLWVLSCSTIDDGELNEEQRNLESQIQVTLNDLDREISRPGREGHEATGEARQGFTDRLNRLRGVREELKANLDQVAKTAEGEWDEFERSVNQSLEAARLALEEARSELRG